MFGLYGFCESGDTARAARRHESGAPEAGFDLWAYMRDGRRGILAPPVRSGILDASPARIRSAI